MSRLAILAVCAILAIAGVAATLGFAKALMVSFDAHPKITVGALWAASFVCLALLIKWQEREEN